MRFSQLSPRDSSQTSLGNTSPVQIFFNKLKLFSYSLAAKASGSLLSTRSTLKPPPGRNSGSPPAGLITFAHIPIQSPDASWASLSLVPTLPCISPQNNYPCRKMLLLHFFWCLPQVSTPPVLTYMTYHGLNSLNPVCSSCFSLVPKCRRVFTVFLSIYGPTCMRAPLAV